MSQCRTCMLNQENMVNLFEIETDTQITYAEILLKCTSINITKVDSFSTSICKSCQIKLTECYKFIAQCHTVQSTLTKPEAWGDNEPKLEILKEELQLDRISCVKNEDKIDDIIKNGPDENTRAADEGAHQCCFCRRSYCHMSSLKRHYVNCPKYTIMSDLSKCFERYNRRTWRCILCDSKVSTFYGNQTEHVLKHFAEVNSVQSKWFDLLNFLFVSNEPKIKCKYCEKLFGDKLTALTHLSACFKRSFYNIIKAVIEKHFMKIDEDKVKCEVCQEMIEADDCTINHHLSTCVKVPSQFLDINVLFSQKPQNNDDKLDVDLKMGEFIAHGHVMFIEKAVYKCKLCENFSGEKSTIVGHVMDHFAQGSFQCDVCYIWFETRKILKEHKFSTHRSDKVFACHSCPRTFVYEQKFIEHCKISHEGLAKFQCATCGQMFLDNEHMLMHSKIHEKHRKHLCTICGRNFSLKENLKTHMLRHGGEKRFICEICDKRFLTASLLKTHSITHTELRAYSCNVCGCLFKRAGALRSHMTMRHSGVVKREFECSWCHKRFAKVFCYKQHILTHTGEKPFECHVCGRKFSKKFVLTVHMRLHTGERPHMCVNCGKSFAQAAALTSHLRHQHADQ